MFSLSLIDNSKLNELKQKNLDELVILNEKDIIEDNEFNLELSIKESENIKYKDSLFFMSIYNEKKNTKRNICL